MELEIVDESLGSAESSDSEFFTENDTEIVLDGSDQEQAEQDPVPEQSISITLEPSFSLSEDGSVIVQLDQFSLESIKEILTPSPITKEFVDYSLLEILLFVCAACLLGNLIYKFFGGVSWRR
ncbi:hypothetical protein [Jeotgalibaca porci]|uniref:hypothetical protein n=1 Tax=Jeotgalibaca porci TaxID=1868793 RepID=UPI0035A0E439